MPTWNSGAHKWEGAGTLYIPLHESPAETERKRLEALKALQAPADDGTWYSPGETWESTRTPWD